MEKLLSHSLEVLGVGQIDMDGVKMLSGLRPFLDALASLELVMSVGSKFFMRYWINK